MDDWAKQNRAYHDAAVSDYEEIVRPAWLPDAVFRFRDVFAPIIRDVPRDARILEIGPGPGDFCRELIGLGFQNIHAVDISPAMIGKVTSESPRICGAVGDAIQLPYRSEVFDFINVKGCLHHVARVSDAIAEISRCLKPEGRFRIQEPNVGSFLTAATPESEPKIERPLDLAEIERLLRNTGLTIEIRRTFLHFEMARLLSEQGLDRPAMDAMIDTLNPIFDRFGQGEIFLIVGRKFETSSRAESTI